MSEETATLTDPFDPALLDEETELRALARSLELANGFSLLFARCNQPDQRRRLIAALRSKLPRLNIQEIHFDGPISHLLRELQERLDGDSPDAVFVSGLEYSMPRADEAQITHFVANLNASRNSFSEVVHCPLVLWMPEYVLTAIARGAPDFFSVRSGVYYFAITPSHTAGTVENLTSGEVWETENLSLSEKLERITIIQELLNDYEALPLFQRDKEIEARLLNRLGILLNGIGRWSEAEKIYMKCLYHDRESQDRAGEYIDLNNLGVVYLNQGRLDDAIKVLQSALLICQELKDRVSEGQTLGNLGNVYNDQGQLEEATKVYERALAIFRKSGDRFSEGRTLGNLGNIYLDQQMWEEATKAYEQALAIFRESGDRVNQGRTLNNLGNVYNKQDRRMEATEASEESLAIRQEFGDTIGEGRTLGNLGNVYESQGRGEEAIKAYEQALAIFQESEDRLGEGQTLHNLALLYSSLGDLTRARDYARASLDAYRMTEYNKHIQDACKLLGIFEEVIKAESLLMDNA